MFTVSSICTSLIPVYPGPQSPGMKFLVDMRADLLQLAAGGGGGSSGAGERGRAAGGGGGGQEGRELGAAAGAGAGPTGGTQRLEPAEAAALRAMAEHLRCGGWGGGGAAHAHS